MSKFNMSILRFLLIIMLFLFTKEINAQSLSVITNIKGAPSSLTSGDLKKIFKAEKQKWDDGSKVVLAMMKTSTSIGGETCTKVYGLSTNDVNKFWITITFQGKASGIKFFDSEDALKGFVESTTGAIGIVSSGVVNKKVKIDGKDSF